MIWLDAAILEKPLWERKAFDSSYVKTLEEVLDLPSPWYQENAKGAFRVEHLKRATVSQNEQTHLCVSVSVCYLRNQAPVCLPAVFSVPLWRTFSCFLCPQWIILCVS